MLIESTLLPLIYLRLPTTFPVHPSIRSIMNRPHDPSKCLASDHSSNFSRTIGSPDTPTSTQTTPTIPRTAAHSPPNPVSFNTLGRSTFSPSSSSSMASSHTVGSSATPSPSSSHTLGRSEVGEASSTSSRTLEQEGLRRRERWEGEVDVVEMMMIKAMRRTKGICLRRVIVRGLRGLFRGQDGAQELVGM
jgi:hypothetical protein